MSEDEISQGSILKQNWHLMLLCIGLIVGGVVLGFREPEVEETPLGDDIVAVSLEDLTPEMADAADENYVRPFEVKSQQTKKATAAVIQYEKENAEAGSGPIVEKNLYRLGNIHYAMLFDYDKAIFYYSRLIEEYPETDKIQMAYVALADSYGKMGNFEEEMNTYDTIMDHFPEESPAYQYAWGKLKGDEN